MNFEKLTYNKSKLWPDNAKIKWVCNIDHEGYLDGKLKYRVITSDGSDGLPDSRFVEMRDRGGDWEPISPVFSESVIYCDLCRKNKHELADKYNHYHSLHACHQFAEDYIDNIIHRQLAEIHI